MVSDKKRLLRRANVILAAFAISPVIYIMIAALLELEGRVPLHPDVFPLLIAFLAISSANIGALLYIQTRGFLATTIPYGPTGRTLQLLATGGLQSQVLPMICGLLLSIFSGSIIYVVGFSPIT